MKLKYFSIAIILFITHSCIPPRISETSLNFNKNSQKGMVIGTVTFLNIKPKCNSYFPIFKSSNNKEYQLLIQPKVSFGEKHIGELDNGLTYLFALELDEDNYKFNSVRLSTIGYRGTINDYAFRGFEVPFSVKKGEITYLGNIVINEWAKKGEDLVFFSNKFERDLEEFKIKMPTVDFQNTINSNSNIIYN
jgi:hypothetical protein